MSEEKYDQNLRNAMGEINKIMEKYDIGGFVILSSRTHQEYKLFLEPTWSILKLGEEKIDFAFKKAVDNELSESVGMLLSICDLCGHMYLKLDSIQNQLNKHVEITHKPFGKHGITPSKA